MSEHELGKFDVLDLLSSAWHGKQYYFIEDEAKGIIYSRDCCECITLDEAISEFASRIGDDGSLLIDAEPVRHGHWNERYDTQYHFECSICKYLHQYKDNYCPLCGAKMDEEVSE